MGSYDSTESSIVPNTSSPPPRQTTPRRRSAPASPSMPAPASPPAPATTPQSSYDPEYKTIIALGGGLSPNRIVAPIPDTVRDGDIGMVIKYMMSDDVVVTTDDRITAENRSIADAVQERMGKSDWRLVINEALNYLGSSKVREPIVNYLTVKTQQGEDGTMKFNYADLAVLSHEEGGKSLDYRL